jgi:hypothetical protein
MELFLSHRLSLLVVTVVDQFPGATVPRPGSPETPAGPATQWLQGFRVHSTLSHSRVRFTMITAAIITETERTDSFKRCEGRDFSR